MRSTLSTLTKQTMGRVRWRNSTKQRSITLAMRSLRRGAGAQRKTTATQASPAAAAGASWDKPGTSAGREPERDSVHDLSLWEDCLTACDDLTASTSPSDAD
jgi:hypothetical protein